MAQRADAPGGAVMFARALKLASRFTYPVIISRRHYDRSIECGYAAFVVLNDRGWIVTAAHLFSAQEALERSAGEINEYFRKIAAIQANRRLSAVEKRRRIFRLRVDPKWVTNVTYWWGRDGVRLVDVRILREADLAVGRLEPFDRKAFRPYPILKNPATLDVGTPLCKLGYPFEKVDATYDEAEGRFRLRTRPLPLAGFPMEGIYTRTLPGGRSADGRYEIKFLETSSPGLTGQSGGPLFDARGTLWGVQSRTDIHSFRVRTRTLGPGSRPSAGERVGDETLAVRLGVAVHPELLVRYLRDNGIRFRLSDY